MAIFVHRFSDNISVENRETLGNSIVEIQKIENTKLTKRVNDRVPFYPEKLSDSTVISKLTWIHIKTVYSLVNKNLNDLVDSKVMIDV